MYSYHSDYSYHSENSEHSEYSDNEYDYPDEEPSENWIYLMYKNRYKPLYIKNICVRKVKQENGKYKKCKKELFKCDYCGTRLCSSLECIPSYMVRTLGGIYPRKEHDKCLDCNNITCNITGICEKCEVNNHLYDMITEDVAVGSYRALLHYDKFDLVINLDYPHNKVEKDEIKYIEDIDYKNTHVIKCGYEDNDSITEEKLENLLKMISDFEEQKEKPIKILFHCYAGISRSATVAIAYLAKSKNKSVKEIYELALEKRPRINPNNYFRKLLGL